MIYKLYRVELSAQQRAHLKAFIASGSPPSRANQHARILLKADCASGGPGWSDAQIALALEVSTRTVLRVRQTFVQAGLARALNRQSRGPSHRPPARVPLHPPRHGSWLDMAEIELSVLSRQCLQQRIPDRPTLTALVGAWQAERNAAKATVRWQFTSADARLKLKRLYPCLQDDE